MTTLHTPRYPWYNKVPIHIHLPGGAGLPITQWWHGLDWPSVRRGRQIYTEVFAPCHSMYGMCFRHLQEFMSVEEVKALAAEYEVEDNEIVKARQPIPTPDMEGNKVMRPGLPLDVLPEPYRNKNEAKFSNGGAAPPQLALICKGRYDQEHYVFSLITAYNRPLPAGVQCPRQGLFWNPYFPGGFIAMPAPLSDGMVDFEDGTPASVSQMAKDVTTFLTWCCDPMHDERKLVSVKLLITFAVLMPTCWYWAMTRHNVHKLRRNKVWKIGHL